jgi:branched-chain amino acid transport system permease protein
MGTERWCCGPARRQPAFTVVMITIGLGYLARGVVTMIPYWGTGTHTLPVPWKDEVFWLRSRQGPGGVARAPRHHRRHRGPGACCCTPSSATPSIGIAMQATSQNQLAAFYMGIPGAALSTC